MRHPNNNDGGAGQGSMVATTLPRRMLTAAEMHATAKLEFTHFPLYSSVIMASLLPRENPVFGYARGDAVSGTPAAGGGTIVATDLHTNMETARFLANPKMFVCQGIGIYFSPLDWDVGGVPVIQDTHGVAAVALQHVDAIQLALYTGLLRFKVGEKFYATGPAFRFPQNTGLEGPAALSVDDDATAQFLQATALYARGKRWVMDTYPVTIYPQQTFSASVDFIATATNPTLAFNSMLTVALSGILGRETQ